MDLNSPFSMGTTIVGVSYNGGVVLGAAYYRTTGMYVRASDNNITELTDNVYLCSSGSVAETETIADHVRCILHEQTIKLGQPATVKDVANLVTSISYNNKDSLKADMIVGGWDKYEGGKIYEITMGGRGTLIDEQPFAIGGGGSSSSSSSYLYGFFEQTWKDQVQGMMMCEEQAKQMVIRTISLAIDRDGGAVRTVIINSEGVTRKLYPAG